LCPNIERERRYCWNCSIDYAKEGDDLTEILGVQKWEVPLPAQLAGTVKGRYLK